MEIAGIDPGLKGGLAFYNGNRLVVYQTPVYEVDFVKSGKKRKRTEMDIPECVRLIQYHSPAMVYLEKVSAMPGQGVTGMFRFGQNLGQWEGLIGGLFTDLIHVTPQTWKSSYGLHQEKYASLERARELFPDNLNDFKLKKHDGLAEAALIAKYGFETEMEKSDAIRVSE